MDTISSKKIAHQRGKRRMSSFRRDTSQFHTYLRSNSEKNLAQQDVKTPTKDSFLLPTMFQDRRYKAATRQLYISYEGRRRYKNGTRHTPLLCHQKGCTEVWHGKLARRTSTNNKDVKWERN